MPESKSNKLQTWQHMLLLLILSMLLYSCCQLSMLLHSCCQQKKQKPKLLGYTGHSTCQKSFRILLTLFCTALTRGMVLCVYVSVSLCVCVCVCVWGSEWVRLSCRGWLCILGCCVSFLKYVKYATTWCFYVLQLPVCPSKMFHGRVVGSKPLSNLFRKPFLCKRYRSVFCTPVMNAKRKRENDGRRGGRTGKTLRERH